MKKKSILLLICSLIIIMQTIAFGQTVSAPQTYTGLIVDARELGIEPGVAPKIYDVFKREIYGTVNINPDFAIRIGVVQYHNTIAEAIVKETVGDNPIVIRAISRGPQTYKADLTISLRDAEWILKANKRSHFLQDLQVVFII